MSGLPNLRAIGNGSIAHQAWRALACGMRAMLRSAREQPLGRRLVASILLCSTCVALVATGIQLRLDYRRDVSSIEQRMSEIEHSYVESVAVAVWNMDRLQAQTQLRGILRLPDIAFVALNDPLGAPLAQVGRRSGSEPIARTFPVMHTPEGTSKAELIGTLRVAASLDGVYARLMDKAFVILVTQGGKTFVVTLFILFIFQRMVSRPLSALAQAARRLNVNHLSEPIELPRCGRRGHDELDMLADALNRMRSSLQHDVEELNRTRQALWLSEERYRSLVESTNVVPWESDARSGNITFVGPQVDRVLGIARERWYEPGFWQSVVHAEDHGLLLAALKGAAGSRPDVECRLIDGQGRERWMSVQATKLATPDGGRVLQGYLLDVDARKRTEFELERHRAQLEGLVAQRTGELAANVSELEATVTRLHAEVQERQRCEEQLRRQALHDGLTGLPNRSLLMARLEHAIKGAERHSHSLTLLFIDLDRFKLINDSLGHDAGDTLLKIVTERVGECVRASDTFARLGGDEFVLLLANTMPDEVRTGLIERIAEAVSAPVMLAGQEVRITCSIGCSVYPEDGSDPLTLMKHADAAMYQAKEQGRNSVRRFAPGMQQHVDEQLEVESHLRRALERDEFVLHYQPQVDLRSGEIIAMEALIRWKHPQWGMVPPLRFIPLAEESDLIVQIGEWVLHTACKQAVAWQRAGLPALRMGVNLSARQFLSPRLEGMVADALAQSGLAPGLLELELTESVSMKNPEETLRILSGFDAMGIGLAIDDFGTGYSNLAYLKRFPMHRLKIDRSFVADLTTDRNNAVIVEAIVGMAHKLGLQVVAEGVETVAQRNLLLHSGCDTMQGYWFSRPLAAEACTALLAEHCRLSA